MPVPGDLGKVLAAAACGAFVTVAEPVMRIALLVVCRSAPAVLHRPCRTGGLARARPGLESGAA